MVDAILLRAAQADDSLADGFMRLAQERQVKWLCCNDVLNKPNWVYRKIPVHR